MLQCERKEGGGFSEDDTCRSQGQQIAESSSYEGIARRQDLAWHLEDKHDVEPVRYVMRVLLQRHSSKRTA